MAATIGGQISKLLVPIIRNQKITRAKPISEWAYIKQQQKYCERKNSITKYPNYLNYIMRNVARIKIK